MGLNKNTWILIGIAVLIAILCMGGCHLYHKGFDDARTGAKIAQVEKKIKVDFDSVAWYRNKYSIVNDSVGKANKRADSVIKLHQRFQFNANQQKSAYVAIIKSLSDSIKNFKVDSTQIAGGTDNILIAVHNYPIVVAQLDTCKRDNDILNGKLAGKDLELVICNRGSNAKDTTIKDLNIKANSLIDINKKKIRNKNFWIFAGWGTSIGKTALFVYTAIKSSALK